MALAWVGAVPVWLALLVVARDVIILSGAVSYYFLVQRFQAAPTLTSKLNTLAQLVLVLVVLLDGSVFPVLDLLVTGLIAITALTTVASGANYVWTWGRDAWIYFFHSRRVS